MHIHAANQLARQLVSHDSLWPQQITCISLATNGKRRVELPQLACPKLLQLHLSGFVVTLSASTHNSAGHSTSARTRGLVQSCPQLRRLSLTRSWVELVKGSSRKAAAALSLLTALTALTRLHLGTHVYGTTRVLDEYVELHLGRLSALTGLQQLSLRKPSVRQLHQLFRDKTLQQQQQQQLAVVDALQQQQHQQLLLLLLPCLTKLFILADQHSVEYSPSTTPGLYQLTNLRHLGLKGACVASVAQLATPQVSGAAQHDQPQI